ncbi:isochorismate synthase [Micropruina sp.]|uniref:isochorismate synthase n=1 Tax=Micropruina sp. TaxID=2737536 RepID=UPI0039E4DB96
MDEGSVAWLRRGDGMVGLGCFARVEVADPAEADAWWKGFVGGLEHHSEVSGVAGSGPVAFGSFSFDPGNTAGTSRLVVPRVVIGRRDGSSWMTVLSEAPDPLTGPVSLVELVETPAPPLVELVETSASSNAETRPLLVELVETPAPPLPPRDVQVIADTADEDRWRRRVAEAVRRIESNGLEKVVLARAVTATASEPIDVRHLVGTLSEGYPSCWTFSVDGLVGASPEMLVRRERGLATSRVLAGTIRRSGSEETDLKLASSLARSSKNLAEHELAVASVAEALAPLCSGMNVPESPYVLELPNVLHLATDVTAVAHKKASSLKLAAALHPSAAVCGTPTSVARAAIAELEGLDRGRYSGPVGWIDTNGDGEWAIALRCGMVDAADPRRINLFAGCGIVEGSDPDEELAETKAKLVPMLAALGL